MLYLCLPSFDIDGMPPHPPSASGSWPRPVERCAPVMDKLPSRLGSSRPHGTRTCELEDLYLTGASDIFRSGIFRNAPFHHYFPSPSNPQQPLHSLRETHQPRAWHSLMTPICMRSAKLKTALISASSNPQELGWFFSVAE